jgi:hypothetical protein
MDNVITIEGSYHLKVALIEEVNLPKHRLCLQFQAKNYSQLIDKHIMIRYDSEGPFLSHGEDKGGNHFHLPLQYNDAKEAIKDVINETTFFKEGEWYRINESHLGRFSHMDNNAGVAIFSQVIDCRKEIFTLMTNQKVGEILTVKKATRNNLLNAFTNLAKTKGLIGGALTKCLQSGIVYRIPTIEDDYTFNVANDSFWVGYGDSDHLICVYQNGTWSEVVEEPLTLYNVSLETKIPGSDNLTQTTVSNIVLSIEHLMQIKEFINKQGSI